MADAGLNPEQVAHVNAHATSTRGRRGRMPGHRHGTRRRRAGVVISATKSMTGHLLGGAGAVESVAAILALRERVAPPTINLEDPDDDAGLEIATEATKLEPRDAAPMAVLNNSFGFGGHNVALAFTAP